MQVKHKFCKTKIICTLGPACDNEETVRALIKEGLDGARFNFSHGTHPEHKERIERFRKVEKEFGLKLPCILDTKGPEIRLGKFEQPVILQEGQKYTLTINEVMGDINHAMVSHKGITKDLKVGDSVLIDDGLVELKVDNITDTDVNCTVVNTGKISSNKGVNLPGIKTSLPSLTEKDIGDLKFGVENGFDMVAASFIRNKQDCLNIKKYLKDFGGEHIQLIVKIENQEGLDNFDEILTACEGVMVARGDLGVEIPVERIPYEQKKMIRKCCRAGKFVITATQMLDSMITNPRPTRAEVTDIANAIIDGSSVIMLSGETASGKHPIESVRYMNAIALETEKHLDLTELSYTMRDLKGIDLKDNISYKKAIDYSVCVTANLLNVIGKVMNKRHNDYNLFVVKLGLLFMTFPINITMNLFFFTNKNIQVNYVRSLDDISMFWSNIANTVYSSILANALLIILKFICLTHNSVRTLRKMRDVQQAKEKSVCILRCIKIRIVIYYLLSLDIFKYKIFDDKQFFPKKFVCPSCISNTPRIFFKNKKVKDVNNQI